MTAIRVHLSKARFNRIRLPTWLWPVAIGATAVSAVVAALSMQLISWPAAAPAPVRPTTAAGLDAFEAQAGPTGAPLLWSVHKGKATVYLFGSIHALQDNMSWMDPRLFQAFDTADAAWFEVSDLDSLPPLRGFDGPALAARPVLLNGLTDVEKKQLKIIVNRYDWSLDELTHVRPWAMAEFIEELDRSGGGFSTEHGVDYTLFHRAKSLKIATGGFESNKLHYSYLYDIGVGKSDKDGGTARLQHALASHFGTGEPGQDIGSLVKDWRAGDERALTGRVLRDRKDDPQVDDVLLVKRNRLWVPKIEDLLKGDKTVFVAVGAAHMLGPDGLVAQLRGKGYTVTRLDPPAR